MHISEGMLPVTHAVGWFAVSAPFVIYGAREAIRIAKESPEERLLLAGAGAFTFLLSAIKLPSVSGSSSHPTGTGLGVVLFRPPVMAFLGTIVLLFQAILLAHGGLTTLGANVFSMAIAGPWAGYLFYKLAKPLGTDASVFAAFFAADLVTYVITSIQLALAYPDVTSGFVGGFTKYAGIFAVTQIPLAIMEGLVGIIMVRVLQTIALPQLRKLGVLPTPTLTGATHG